MTLKAILLDFPGAIVNDRAIHQQLIDEILLGENLRPSASEYREVCLGKSDRACLKQILSRRGRVVSQDYLTELVLKKAKSYAQKLEKLDFLPLYPGIKPFITQLKTMKLQIGVVTGALSSEVELVLRCAQILPHVNTIVSGDDIKVSKPEPDGYLLAVERLSLSLELQPSNCLAIEDTPVGITAAKRAGMSVVGVANTYPLHLLQRQTDWVIDSLGELELERVKALG